MNAACYQHNSNCIVSILIPNYYGPKIIKKYKGGSSGQKSEKIVFPFLDYLHFLSHAPPANGIVAQVSKWCSTVVGRD